MHLRHKIVTWLKEIIELFHGPVYMHIHREAPEHYLGFVLDKKVPVVLIPGLLNKWSYLKPIGDTLSLLGHPVHIVPELGSTTEEVPLLARLLRRVVVKIVPKRLHRIHARAKHVRKYLNEKNIKGAVLVGFSKGGLIGKYLLRYHNEDERALGLVAIASPFNGSAAAHLLPFRIFQEMRMESALVKTLDAEKAVNKKIISIYPSYDTHIWAPQKSHLEGAAANIELPIGGHSVLRNKELQNEVIRAVEIITRWR